MRTRPLLRDVRHKAMITPVNPLRTKLIHISPSYWTIYRSFEIILEWELSIGWEFEANIRCKIHCFKKHSIWYESLWIIFKKMRNRRGQLGLQRTRKSKARANVFERTPATNDIFWFRSPTTWTLKTRQERKYVNSDKARWKELESTTLISEVDGGTNMCCKASKLTFYKRNRKHGMGPKHRHRPRVR